jgi:hypothetical protein
VIHLLLTNHLTLVWFGNSKQYDSEGYVVEKEAKDLTLKTTLRAYRKTIIKSLIFLIHPVEIFNQALKED